MGLPVYVVNFDELVDSIIINGANIEIDTGGIEDILNQYFPDILELAEKYGSNIANGTQKIKGLISEGETIIFTPEKDIFITGVTFSQNLFDRSCHDQWRMSVRNGEDEIVLLEDVYVKDALQHKYFERYYPVPAGYEIVITPLNYDGRDKTYWFDLEYLEGVVLYEPEPKPTPDTGSPDKIMPGEEMIYLIQAMERGKEIGYIEIDENNTQDLIITMTFDNPSGAEFPDLEVKDPDGNHFGYTGFYFGMGGAGELTGISSCSSAWYNGLEYSPEIMIFKNPKPGKWFFYGQSYDIDTEDSTVTFTSSHEVNITYIPYS